MAYQSNDAITFLPLGALLQTFPISGLNIVQSFPTPELYRKYNIPYFGETIGKVANRIKDGKIDNLNGRSYQLAKNNGPNSLHGGEVGWGKRVWEGPKPVGLDVVKGLDEVPFSGKGDVGKLEGGESVEFRLRDEDGTEGYPGMVEAWVWCTSGTQKISENGKEKVATVLQMEYEAQLVGGADETVINMTNHSYFNLAGTPTIEGTKVTLFTDLYLPVDETGIPIAGPSPYEGIKANTPFTLGPTEPDLDDCFVLNTDPSSIPLDTRSLPLKKLVHAYHPKSQIHLEVLSTEPAFQFYTGKYIDVPAIDEDGVNLPARGKRSGFCVEPSRYVDAVNREEWKDMVVLKKGTEYGSRIIYRAWSDV